MRIRVGDAVRAVSVAEVIAPGGAAPRELMVALVRAGVTATCSSADKPRYGDLSVDSNLPDARIAIGGPGENSFTAAVLDASDDSYRAELDRQLQRHGRARVWVPAAAPLARQWVPGADLRGVAALPVLILVGGVDGVVEELARAEVTVEQDASAGGEPFESRTVAVVNRGVPGFAVEPDGTLHTSLMRSCTGWPSGTWIDPPRRTAPDGSNFQLQHWTHTFDYAVVGGSGDWRAVEVPSRSAEFNHPLRAVTAHGHGGGLPPWGALLEIEPAGQVQLGALKATGNPLVCGSARATEPAAGVTVRLVEMAGRAADVTLTSGLRNAAVTPLNLLEEPTAQAPGPVRLHGYQIATLSTQFNLPTILRAEHRRLGPEAEVAQPLYARYWLHNRGPAPLGGLPAVAYLHPEELTAETDSDVVLRLTAASDCTDTPLHGRVWVLAPPGWPASPQSLPFVLPPGGHLETDVVLRVPAGAAPGRYPVRVELAVTGGDSSAVPPSWRQTVEDVCIVTVGDSDGRILTLLTDPAPVDVKAGESAVISVRIGTDAGADLAAEAQLISPWGTWEWMGPAAQAVPLPAGGSTEIGFDVAPPAWVDPGEWWALIRVGCAGRLVYTPAVKVTVR